ncbi:MAG: IPTL-CTERM sorting domain-containing protein [Acidobacteria bacterium]|nr:IPTL-CTERM sorting domain-containing protein [Acidobacteriota bacterium]
MKRLCTLLGTLFFVAGLSFGQVAANDVGLDVQNTGPFFNGIGSDGGGMCPPAGFVTGSFSGLNTQLGRIFRDGIPSACPNKAYPGIFNPGTTYNYETYTYTNTSGAAACVTINFDPNSGGGAPCGTNAHMSAYLNSYDPNNQGANFLGDVGSSVTQPFSFEVAAGQNVVLVVTNTASAAVCDFSFEVVGLPCQAGAQIPTLGQWGLIAFVALLAGLALFVQRRLRA